MNYEKPQVNVLTSAVAAIQDPIEKSNQVDDFDPNNPNLASAAAYAADE
jgi:hypothetical protein